MRDQAIKPVVPQSNVCISLANLETRDTSCIPEAAGHKWIKILGTEFFNEIIDKEGRYLYMVRVSIQIESVPTLTHIIVPICLSIVRPIV